MAFACRNMKVAEKKELAKWLKLHNLELDGRTRRKLTDVMAVARMFKRIIHPQLISMHRYNHHASDYDMKLQNWKDFNRNVLTKLGLGHTNLALEQLAKGHVGAIETLLYNLITVGRSKGCCSLSKRSSQKFSKECIQKKSSTSGGGGSFRHSLTHIPQQARIALTPPDVICMDVEHLIKGKMVKEPMKLVSYKDYLNVLRECQEKDSCISSVRHMTQYLESLTMVKDERIEDLLRQLERLTGKNCS